MVSYSGIGKIMETVKTSRVSRDLGQGYEDWIGEAQCFSGMSEEVFFLFLFSGRDYETLLSFPL